MSLRWSEYEYDAQGRVTSYTPPTPDDRLVSYTPPVPSNHRPITYAYNNLGQKTA